MTAIKKKATEETGVETMLVVETAVETVKKIVEETPVETVGYEH